MNHRRVKGRPAERPALRSGLGADADADVDVARARAPATIIAGDDARASAPLIELERYKSFAGSLLAVTAVAIACSSTSADDPNGTGPNAPGLLEDGGVAPSVKITDGSANDADDARRLGSLNATSLTASYDTDSRWFTGAVPGRPSLTELTELTELGVGTPSSLQGNIAALGTGVNANYATCTHCMMVLAGYTATDRASSAPTARSCRGRSLQRGRREHGLTRWQTQLYSCDRLNP